MKWKADRGDYAETCLRLSKNLTNFKRDPVYAHYVGNDLKPHLVDEYKKVVKVPYVHKNDKIGNPMLKDGMSAGTLRYMKVWQDCMRFDFNSVVEIGGGYGGQALIFWDYGDVDYMIIDIPSGS